MPAWTCGGTRPRKKPVWAHPCPEAPCRRGSRLPVLRPGAESDRTQAGARSALPLATGPRWRRTA
jgi:hypothetical protein